jgi:hypothetical protein
MKRIAVMLVAVALYLLSGSVARAQVVYYYSAEPAYCPPPVAVTTYYAPAPVAWYPSAAVVRTRYRPLLGGTVTRVRYRAPVVYARGWWW